MSKSSAAGLSDYEIRKEGWQALTERLGIAGAIRFLTQYDPGHGDYTQERREIFAELTLEDALRQIEKQSQKNAP
jgi:hypothetical protein